MKEFIKYKTIAITTAILVLLLIIIYLIGRKAGKNLTASGNKGLMPSQTDYGKTLSETESQQVIKHANALYNDMKGLNFWKRDASIYTEYLASSDRVFVGTANYFYDNFGNGDNLAKWIKGEAYWFTNLDLNDTTDSILSRLARFGIVP